MKKDDVTKQIEEYVNSRELEVTDEICVKKTEKSLLRYLIEDLCKFLIAIAILVFLSWVGLKMGIEDRLDKVLEVSKQDSKEEELIESCYKVTDNSRFDYVCENYDKLLDDEIIIKGLDEIPYKLTIDIYEVTEDNKLIYVGSLYQEFIGSKNIICLQTKIPVNKTSTLRVLNNIKPLGSDT